jgi:hypothetical protein
MRNSLTIWTFFLTASMSRAFVTKKPQLVIARSADSTRLFLEDWVADLVDGELIRQSHKDDYEREWMEKNREAVMNRMEVDFTPEIDPDVDEIRQRRKDERLARKSPEQYCADRCVSTGHCDVYEDL